MVGISVEGVVGEGELPYGPAEPRPRIMPACCAFRVVLRLVGPRVYLILYSELFLSYE